MLIGCRSLAWHARWWEKPELGFLLILRLRTSSRKKSRALQRLSLAGGLLRNKVSYEIHTLSAMIWSITLDAHDFRDFYYLLALVGTRTHKATGSSAKPCSSKLHRNCTAPHVREIHAVGPKAVGTPFPIPSVWWCKPPVEKTAQAVASRSQSPGYIAVPRAVRHAIPLSRQVIPATSSLCNLFNPHLASKEPRGFLRHASPSLGQHSPHLAAEDSGHRHRPDQWAFGADNAPNTAVYPPASFLSPSPASPPLPPSPPLRYRPIASHCFLVRLLALPRQHVRQVQVCLLPPPPFPTSLFPISPLPPHPLYPRGCPSPPTPLNGPRICFHVYAFLLSLNPPLSSSAHSWLPILSYSASCLNDHPAWTSSFCSLMADSTWHRNSASVNLGYVTAHSHHAHRTDKRTHGNTFMTTRNELRTHHIPPLHSNKLLNLPRSPEKRQQP